MAEETYSAEQVDQLLRCPVCLDKYKEPKILPCQHTFCRSPCLEGLVDMRTRIVRCPECRMEHFVPINGASGFPTNITLINFLDLQAQPVTAASSTSGTGGESSSSGGGTVVGSINQCGVCEKEAETTKCAHCNKFTCESCRKSHFNQMKFDIGRVVNQLRRGVPKLSNRIATVEQKSEQVKQHVEGVKAEVRDTMERYVKELRDRQTLLNSELDTFQQAELRNLRLHQENLEVELASISSYCDSTESALNKTGEESISDTELVNLKRQCSEYMDQIQQSSETEDIPGAKQVRFTFEGLNLQNCISNLGELVVSMPGTHSGRRGAENRRNSDSSLQERETRMGARRWTDAQPMDTVLVTSAEIDSLNIESPRQQRQESPQPAQTSRNPPAAPALYTAEASPSDYASPRTRGTWNRTRHSVPTQSQSQSRTPRRDRTRDALNSGYMFHMGSPSTSALREELHRLELQRLRDLELLNGDRLQAELTRQLDQSMARQNRLRNQSSNVASLFGQEPRQWQGHQDGRGGGRRSNARRVVARRGRSLDDRPVGVAGGAQPSQAADSPSTPPRFLDPLPSNSDFLETEEPPSQTPPNRGTAQRSVRQSQTQTTTTTPTTSTTPRAATVRRVVPPIPGISFEVRLNSPENAANTDNENASGDTGSTHLGTARASDTYRGGDGPTAATSATAAAAAAAAATTTTTNSTTTTATAIASSEEEGSNTFRAVQAGVTTGNAVVAVQSGNDASNEPQPSTSTGNNSVVPFTATATTAAPTAQPAPLRRQGTFTRDSDNSGENDNTPSNPTLAINRPVVNDESVSFNVSLNTSRPRVQMDSDEETTTFRLSSADSLTTMRPVTNYTIKGVPVRVLGSGRGNEPGKFNSPRGVAVSPINDSIVVADSSNNRVQVFDLNGVFLHAFGSHGQGEGELDGVTGVAVNTMGQIVVADWNNHRIQVFDRYGEFQHSFGGDGDGDGQMKHPWGVACDVSGNIYVCDKGNNRVQVFTQDGRWVRQFGRNELRAPHYVAVGEDGRVVVTDTSQNRVRVYNGQGEPLVTFGSSGAGSCNFKSPRGVAVDPQGFISVIDSGNNRVKVFRGDGRFFCAFGKSGSRRGRLKGADGLALAAGGRLVVADRDNHRVQVF